MRAPAVAALSLTLLCCTPSYPLPPGAQLACEKNEECPSPLLCDVELNRCVDTIVEAPRVTLTVAPVPAEGTRATTFTFTATSPDAALRYRWEMLDDAADGGVRVLAAEGSPTLVHRFAFGAADFCPGAGCRSSLPVTVRLKVTNEGGKSTERLTAIIVKNTPPIVDFGEDLFVSEDGVPEVELDLCGGVRIDGGCTTRDPDGDPLVFEGFRQATGDAVVLRDAGPGRVRFTPPSNWQRPLVFDGLVSDGIEQVAGRVRVFRGSHAWTSVGTLDQTYRIHPDYRAVTAWVRGDGGYSQFYSPEAIVSDERGGWWFGDSDRAMFMAAPTGGTVLVHLDAQLVEVERFEVRDNWHDITEAIPSIVAPRGGVPGCLVYRDLGPGMNVGPGSGFARFTPGSGEPLLAHFHSRPPTTTGGVRWPLAVLPVGATGDCWAIGQGPNGAPNVNAIGGELGKLRPDATWVPLNDLEGFPAAWAVEPDGTLWVSERFPVPLSDGGLGPAFLDRFRSELRRITVAGDRSTVDAGGRYFSALATHPAGGLWALDLHARALVRVWPDGTLTQAATPPVGAGRVFGTTGLAVDPIGPAVWVTDSLGEQLYRFDEAPDGGLRVAGATDADDLPPGVNKKGFAGRVALDPATGAVATFVGSLPAVYARWVLVPPHLRRVEGSGLEQVVQGNLRGDPTSGNLWLSNSGLVRRLDLSGRLLATIPHTWGDPDFPSAAPLFVDRRGQAWVASTEGIPHLRVIDPDGSELRRVPLPFVPGHVALASTMGAQGQPREVACAVGNAGEIARIELSTGAVQPLSNPPLEPDGGLVDRPYLCEPQANGRVWVLANQLSTVKPHRALVYEPGTTSPLPPFVVLPVPTVPPGPPDPTVQVTGAGVDEATGDLFFTTWESVPYLAELRRVSVAGSVSTVRVLQGGNRLGIGLDVRTRRVCPGPAPGCVELWVPNRLSEVHRFDLSGEDVDSFSFGRGEPHFDLVP